MNVVDITADANHVDVDIWRGFSVREVAGSPAAATLRFRKATVGGQIVGLLELKEDESATLVLTKKKINSEGGLYVELITGSIEGVLYYD